MTNESIRDKAAGGMLWIFLQKFAREFVSFFVSVKLARMLLPEDYGVVAISGMLLVLMNIFSDGGLGLALVQKKDTDELDYDTMFLTQLGTSSFIYCIVYFLAPWFAQMFENEQLTNIIRVMGLTMPLGALAGVQSSIVSKRMMFKWFFYASFISTIVSAVVGLIMAYKGCGPWALVGQNMSATIVGTIVVFCLLDWRPRFRFSRKRWRSLFITGFKFMGTNLMGTFFSQLKGYALGLKYSTEDLAYYNRGEGIPNLLCNNVDGTIQSVLFPAISKIQDDAQAVKRAIRRAIKLSTYLLMPLLLGLAAISNNLIILLFTEKWAQSIPFMQVLCLCFAIGILCNVNLQALRATGHIGLVLKLEFIKKPIMLIIIILTMYISPIAIAYGILAFNIFVFFVNSYPNKKIIYYSYREQLVDVAENIWPTFIMATLVFLLGKLDIGIVPLLIIQVLSGIFIYLLLSILSKNESFYYVKLYVQDKMRKVMRRL